MGIFLNQANGILFFARACAYIEKQIHGSTKK